MDKAALRELAEDLAMNHEYCPKDVILKASDALLNLLAENQSLTEERTAWRTTAENAEKDAERYRWLREQDDEDFCFSVVKNPLFDVYESGPQLDAAIDAAMKEEK